MMEARHSVKIKRYFSDNGREYSNDLMSNYFAEKGMIHVNPLHITNPISNGIAEWVNQTLMGKVRPTMLQQANLPHVFLAEAVIHADYLKNRVGTRALDGMTIHLKP